MAQPNIKHLDKYIGCFYQDNIEKQVEATKNILVLLLDFKNIQDILDHQSLLQLLSRVLQEEHKKSIQLCVYLQSIFYVLANYQPFHQYLTQFQVGKATMDILQYQIDRFDIRYSQYIQLWKQNGGQRSQQTDSELRKLNYLISKQDKLFFLCINILMNLGEDPNIEKKMRKNGIIKTLIRMLERNDFHLLVITLLFLKKLSIFTESKDQMIESKLLEKLSRFFSCENDVLLQLALGLYKNLSFDDVAKEKIQNAGLIPQFIQLLHGASRFNAIVILYILSINQQIRLSLAYTDLMDLVVKLITHFPQKIVGPELISLAVNLSCNKRNVQHISEEDLHGLADRALKNQDTALLKFCKNVWKNSDNLDITAVGKGLMKEFMKLLLGKSKNEDLIMQVLGVLSFLKLGSAWKQYLNENFIKFLQKQLNSGAEDDIIMETVMVISNICQDAQAAQVLSKTDIFKSLLGLFLDRTDDPQFCIQILYAVYMFLYHKLCLQDIFQEGQVLMRLLLLIDDPHEKLRKMNDDVLNQLREYNDMDLLQGIKQRKFLQYNKEWLKSTEEYGGSNNMNQYGMFDDYAQNQELDPRMWDSEDDYD